MEAFSLHVTVDEASLQRFREAIAEAAAIVEQFAAAMRDAFCKGAVPFILFAEKLQEVDVGRDTDYREQPTPGDLRRLACHNNIVATHMKCWENGDLGWEEMLLSLSVNLAESYERLVSCIYGATPKTFPNVPHAEGRIPLHEFVKKYFGQPSPANHAAASIASARPSAPAKFRADGPPPGKAWVTDANGHIGEIREPASFVIIDDPQTAATPAQQSERDRLIALRTKLMQSAAVSVAPTMVGPMREMTPIDILGRATGETIKVDCCVVVAPLRISPQKGNCGPCKGKGTITFSGGLEEKCAECGGSGNAPTL
jgi:hypothetical protein